jgi:hypothetical protein
MAAAGEIAAGGTAIRRGTARHTVMLMVTIADIMAILGTGMATTGTAAGTVDITTSLQPQATKTGQFALSRFLSISLFWCYLSMPISK